MCGICGIVSRDPIQDHNPVLRMREALVHRGPDGEGQFQDSNVSLGVRRLSIIDLTGGWQPLYNEDHSVVLIVNGEIYNFVELREQLESAGHRFYTRSDCETIVHLYEDYGIDCVQHLRGMFAFALYDTKRKRVFFARDRLGEKPFYLHISPGRIIFGSEIKALLSSGLVPFELDPDSVDLYFHYQYVPEPATPLKQIRKLPAAHLLVVDIPSWRLQEKCYWRMEDAVPLEGNPADLIKAELETISKIIVRADVPVGVALSGGMDSGTIAALAARQYPGTLHAFCVGYPGRPSYDERKDASSLADFLKIPFHEIELTTQDLVSFFPQLVFWRDDPIADISGFGYYSVMKAARDQNVPVMMQGQGGDELFWGYSWVREAVRESEQKARLLKRGFPEWWNYFKLNLPASLTFYGARSWMSSMGGLRPGWQRLQFHKRSPSDQMIFYDLSSDFQRTCREIASYYANGFKEELNGCKAYDLFSFAQPWKSIDICMTRLIHETYLRENGVAQGDRLSMASSVEMRLPFLDYRLVETVIGLRKNQRDDMLPPKAWLKAAVQGIVPQWIMSRPKRGFEPPTREWHHALFQTYGSLLKDGFLVDSGILSPQGASELATGPFPGNVVTPISFKALVLELWCRKFSSL